MKPWKRIEPTTVQKIGWRTIITKTFKMPDGRMAEFQTIGPEQSHCIATIALTPDRHVIVARQFRAGPERIFDELPGGGANEGEDFLEAARRELEEETSYRPNTIESLGSVYKDAYTNTTWHYFLARNCSLVTGGQNLDDHEHVAVRLISIAELFTNARSGRMTDVEAVFLAYEQLQQLQEE